MSQNLSSAAVVIGALRVKLFANLVILHVFCRLLIFFSNFVLNFSFQNTIRLSNNLALEQAFWA